MSRDHMTELVRACSSGSDEALDELMPLVYQRLRKVARYQLSRHGRRRPLDTTALVHELYLKLGDQARVDWRDRAHFFAAASKAMRHILVDELRRAGAEKRGGTRRRVTLEDGLRSRERPLPDLLALDQALTDLESRSPRLVAVVECRFFGGMTARETAEALGIGQRTVERDWARARAYLYRALEGEKDAE